MHVEWELFKWENMFPMYPMALIHTASESPLVCVLASAPLTSLQ